MKKNCWEYKKCGREPNGVNVQALGICPVATEKRLDSVHGGKNAGRACWVVGGTFCQGKVQGTFALKYDTCIDCDFYKLVKGEEYPDFILSATLLPRLK
jgi:hypothetical protein